MCRILIIDDNAAQLAWLGNVVTNAVKDFGNCKLLPDFLNGDCVESIMLPPRPNVELHDTWVNEVLQAFGVTHNTTIDIAIVDLCLTDPPQLRDPEGIWICTELRKRFPSCFLILVSSKSTMPTISGGWFRYVPSPSVRIDEVVGIRDDDPISSRSQLATALRKRAALELAH